MEQDKAEVCALILKEAGRLLETIGSDWLERHPRAPWFGGLSLHVESHAIWISATEVRFREQPELLAEIAQGHCAKLTRIHQGLLEHLPATCLPFGLTARVEAFMNGRVDAEDIRIDLAGFSLEDVRARGVHLTRRLAAEEGISASLDLSKDRPDLRDWICIKIPRERGEALSIPHLVRAETETEAMLRLILHARGSDALSALLRGEPDHLSGFCREDLERYRVAELPRDSLRQKLLRDMSATEPESASDPHAIIGIS